MYFAPEYLGGWGDLTISAKASQTAAVAAYFDEFLWFYIYKQL